jgi:hypothetical protein
MRRGHLLRTPLCSAGRIAAALGLPGFDFAQGGFELEEEKATIFRETGDLAEVPHQGGDLICPKIPLDSNGIAELITCVSRENLQRSETSIRGARELTMARRQATVVQGRPVIPSTDAVIVPGFEAAIPALHQVQLLPTD